MKWRAPFSIYRFFHDRGRRRAHSHLVLLKLLFFFILNIFYLNLEAICASYSVNINNLDWQANEIQKQEMNMMIRPVVKIRQSSNGTRSIHPAGLSLLLAILILPSLGSAQPVYYPHTSHRGCYGGDGVARAAHAFDDAMQHFTNTLLQEEYYSHLAEDAKEAAQLSSLLHDSAEQGVDCIKLRNDYQAFNRALNHLRITYGTESRRHPNSHVEADWREMGQAYRSLHHAIFHSGAYRGFRACPNGESISSSAFKFAIAVAHFLLTAMERDPNSHLAEDLREMKEKAEHLLNTVEEGENCRHVQEDFSEISRSYGHLTGTLRMSVGPGSHEDQDWRELDQAYRMLERAVRGWSFQAPQNPYHNHSTPHNPVSPGYHSHH